MRPSENVERLIGNVEMRSDPETNQVVLQDLLHQFDETREKNPAGTQPNKGRTIMKSRITKSAIAAVVFGAVALGLFQFSGRGSSSAVVWADVARKVEASRGVIVRCTDSIPSEEHDYSITYTSPKYCRKEFYKGEQIIRTGYVDFTASDTYTLIDVFHHRKLCLTTTFRKSDYQLFLEWHADWTNPGFMVQTILSCEHNKLGQKTINDVLCEGIETTDPACLGPLPTEVSNLELEFRLWVSLETGYPVLFESRMSAEYQGKVGESEYTMDQFEWDAELDPSLFEPNIPSDYESVQRPGIVEL